MVGASHRSKRTDAGDARKELLTKTRQSSPRSRLERHLRAVPHAPIGSRRPIRYRGWRRVTTSVPAARQRSTHVEAVRLVQSDAYKINAFVADLSPASCPASKTPRLCPNTCKDAM